MKDGGFALGNFAATSTGHIEARMPRTDLQIQVCGVCGARGGGAAVSLLKGGHIGLRRTLWSFGSGFLRD